jgi:hypothetical protein
MRSRFYNLRKDYILDKYYKELDVLREKAKFVEKLKEEKIYLLNSSGLSLLN